MAGDGSISRRRFHPAEAPAQAIASGWLAAVRAWSMSHAALIKPTWLRACGKFPRSCPRCVSISSARRPRSLAQPARRSKSACAGGSAAVPRVASQPEPRVGRSEDAKLRDAGQAHHHGAGSPKPADDLVVGRLRHRVARGRPAAHRLTLDRHAVLDRDGKSSKGKAGFVRTGVHFLCFADRGQGAHLLEGRRSRRPLARSAGARAQSPSAHSPRRHARRRRARQHSASRAEPTSGRPVHRNPPRRGAWESWRESENDRVGSNLGAPTANGKTA
jgi:hypothetical protein